MKPTNAIYRLTRFTDDPRYEGFACKTRGDLPDSVPVNRTSRKWRVYRFARWWKPMKVVGRVRPFNDNPGCMLYPAFSRRAVDALREFLKPNGEILPLDSNVGEYYLYNVTTIADVLDVRRSEIEWLQRPITALHIPVYQFLPAKVAKLGIFAIPECPHEVYVTEAFVQRVRECGLKGFRFDKVWPMPKGVLWWKMINNNPDRQEGPQPAGEPSRQSIKGNVVHLQFKFANGADRPNRKESSKLKELIKLLDSALAESDPATIPTGSLEGSRVQSGKLRVVFSCPDADALAKKLDLVLKKFDWKPGWTMKKSRKSFFTFSEFWGD